MLPATTDDSLLDNLSYKEAFRYSMTCKTVHQAVSSYIRRKHNLETVLGKYFTTDQILHFRHLQATTGMIISGSTALQFFGRVLYPESDLNLYVEHRYMRPIAEWLANIGYIYIPTHNQDISEQDYISNDANPTSATYPTLEMLLKVEAPERPAYPVSGQYPRIFFRSINKGYINAISILNFEKGNELHGRRTIQITTSPRSPVEMILNFHSTCVMNFITHEKAYSLYPRATFEEYRSLILIPRTASCKRAYSKYVKRGWAMRYSVTGDDFHNLNSSLARGPRYVGDRKTWTIPILPKVDAPSPLLTEMNSWTLRYDTGLKPYLEFSSLVSPQLRYCYLVLDEFLRDQIRKIPILLKKSPDEGEDPHDAMLKSLAVYLNETIAP